MVCQKFSHTFELCILYEHRISLSIFSMPDNKPSYLLLLLATCSSISYFFASTHYVMIKVGVLNAPVNTSKLSLARLQTLHSIWYVKLVRRIVSFLVRTPVRRDILKLVNFNIPVPVDRGCIIVICHTPWKRLLVQWCLENKFALLVGGGKWTDKRRTIQRQGAGVTELRGLVKYLQLGGRVVIKAVVFNNKKNCPVKFLGNNCNASLFAERLAVITKVPILAVIPRLSGTAIEFTAGPQFSTNGLKSKSTTITTQVISFFEKEIESNPILLSNYV